ncbi:MAG: hypothetical protein KAX67_02785 [Pararheinheimera sp.]|nr:hypothetical protein [Rheinheimera sp.]
MKVTLKIINISSGDESLPPTILGDTIEVDGVVYDFSPLIDGAEINIGLPFTDSVRRRNGVLEVGVLYRYSTVTAEVQQSTNPEDYTFMVTDGQCPDPIKSKPVEVVNEPTS